MTQTPGEEGRTMACLYLGVTGPEVADTVRAAATRAGYDLAEWQGESELPARGQVVVLLDTRQPGENPYEIARSLRADPRVQVVLLVDSRSRQIGEELARVVGARLVTKPLEEEALARLLTRIGRTGIGPGLETVIGDLDRVVDPARLATNLLADMEVREGEDNSLIHALTDPETGLFNYPFMAFRMEEEFKRATRFDLPLTMVLLDLVPVGSGSSGPAPVDLLLALSGRLLTETRDIDSLGRWEEKSLMLLLPGTPLAGARTMIGRILPDTESLLRDMGGWRILAGIAQIPADGISKRQQFLAAARQALANARVKADDASSVTALAGPDE